MVDEYPNIDESLKDRAVSKKDELNYRISIQHRVDNCLDNIAYETLSTHVKSLKMSLYFEIPGLPFIKEIDAKEVELNNLMLEYIDAEKEAMGRFFYTHANQAKFKLRLSQWYWTTYLEFLLGLLAKHDALLKAKGFVEHGEE